MTCYTFLFATHQPKQLSKYCENEVNPTDLKAAPLTLLSLHLFSQKLGLKILQERFFQKCLIWDTSGKHLFEVIVRLL